MESPYFTDERAHSVFTTLDGIRESAGRCYWGSHGSLTATAEGVVSAEMFGYVVGEYRGVHWSYLEIGQPMCRRKTRAGRYIGRVWAIQKARIIRFIARDDPTLPEGALAFNAVHGETLRVFVRDREQESLLGRTITFAMEFKPQASFCRLWMSDIYVV
ncbi:hypothetical protein C8R47DRAFT_1207240 [Mycena vitilis]|nr:hypothetical protein C8R47DRAFT_1207240 [Mycena vitilis]